MGMESNINCALDLAGDVDSAWEDLCTGTKDTGLVVVLYLILFTENLTFGNIQ